MAENAPLCPTMAGTYLEVTGCLGAALVVLLGGDMDFKIVDGFLMGLETGFTLLLVNVNALGRAGALREPMDSIDLSLQCQLLELFWLHLKLLGTC